MPLRNECVHDHTHAANNKGHDHAHDVDNYHNQDDAAADHDPVDDHNHHVDDNHVDDNHVDDNHVDDRVVDDDDHSGDHNNHTVAYDDHNDNDHGNPVSDVDDNVVYGCDDCVARTSLNNANNVVAIVIVH
jgi:hypothetical protein